jgi:hypothetical protein
VYDQDSTRAYALYIERVKVKHCSDGGVCSNCRERQRNMVYNYACGAQHRSSACRCHDTDCVHPWCSVCVKEYFISQIAKIRLFDFKSSQISCLLRCPICSAQVCPFSYASFEEEYVSLRYPSLDDLDSVNFKSSLLEQKLDYLIMVLPSVNLASAIPNFPALQSAPDPSEPPETAEAKKLRNKTLRCGWCKEKWGLDKPCSHYANTCPNLENEFDPTKPLGWYNPNSSANPELFPNKKGRPSRPRTPKASRRKPPADSPAQ